MGGFNTLARVLTFGLVGKKKTVAPGPTDPATLATGGPTRAGTGDPSIVTAPQPPVTNPTDAIKAGREAAKKARKKAGTSSIVTAKPSNTMNPPAQFKPRTLLGGY